MSAENIILSFPQEQNEKLPLDSKYVDSQGYSRKIFKNDSFTKVEREINNEDYPKYLQTLEDAIFKAETTPLTNSFQEHFSKHHDSIINFEELFFFHYSQIASSLKSTYDVETQKFISKNPDCDETVAKENTDKLKKKVDEVFKDSFEIIHDHCQEVFIKALKANINQDGTFNINELNKNLNQSIKSTKKTCDKIFKDALNSQNLPIYSKKTRKSTTAFGNETKMITKKVLKGKEFSQETHSSPITSHTKNKGPAITKVILKEADNIIHQSYRTSHLISTKSKPDEAIETLNQFMAHRFNPNKPLIYNLYTSVHSGEKNAVSLKDALTNQQTKRLKTLLKAQNQFNKDKSYNNMFFTINTPTNTYGQEITLKNSDPIIQQAAISNALGLAIILFDENNDTLKAALKTYKDALKSKDYSKVSTLIQSLRYESRKLKTNDEAKQFLIQRFDNDDAATHKYAKMTATCIGILSGQSAQFNLIEGCKSGNERTGNILGRIATFFKYSPKTLNDLDKGYNDLNLYDHFSSGIASNDMGAPPKTTVKTGGLLPNTNETEEKSMTNLQSSKMSLLQSHKDKDFDYALPAYSLNTVKLALPALGLALGLGLAFACPLAIIIPIVTVLVVVVIYNLSIYALDQKYQDDIQKKLLPSQFFKQQLKNQEPKNSKDDIQLPSLGH